MELLLQFKPKQNINREFARHGRHHALSQGRRQARSARFAPGTQLPYHEHVEIEQTWVLEGALEDEEGIATLGNFVWRPAGNRHNAHSPKSCLVLSIFLKPNKFLDKDTTGWDTKGGT